MRSSIPPSRLAGAKELDVVVAGVGMATVGGVTARQTVHAVAGNSVKPPPSPFRRVTLHPDDDERVQVLFCPWLGAWASLADRLASLALLAVDEALHLPTADGPQRFTGRVGVALAAPAPRDDLGARETDEVMRALRSELGPASTAVFEGDAALYPALLEAEQRLARREAEAVVLVAVDSFVTLAQARGLVDAPQSWWRPDEPRPSEAGVALLLMRAADARARGASMASILSADTRTGTSNELNEEPVDGLPMTALLLSAKAHGPFRHVFGQAATSSLRSREWELGLSRNLGVLADEASVLNVERRLGRLGAAAAPASLAYAVLGAWEGVLEPAGPAIVWSVSDDGVRGACAVSLRSAEGTQAEARVPFVGGERLRVHRLEPIRWATRHLRASWDPPPTGADDGRSVHLDTNEGAPKPLLHELRQWVGPLLDDVRVLGRHRSQRQYAESRTTEVRIIRRLNRLVGAGTQGHPIVRAWWDKQLEGNDPWRAWAISLALGTFEGGLDELPECLAMLPEDARDEAQLAGEAVALLPAIATATAVRSMASHGHPVVRAAAFVAGARLGRAGWDQFEHVLGKADGPTLVDVALWEAAYLAQKPSAACAELLRRWVGSLDARIAWHAARACLVHGDPAPYQWLMMDGQAPSNGRPALAKVLGARSFEVVAMVGRHEDSKAVTRWLRKTPPTPAVLDALARFGNVEIWGYLTAQLADDDLKEPAARALEVLFGPRVPELHRHDPVSWREAIQAMDLDPRKRTRLGVSFSPRVFDREVRLGEASRASLEMRQAELCARHRRLPCRPLHGLAADAEAALTQAAQSWNRVGDEGAGAWT
jgi:hypothetical protein